MSTSTKPTETITNTCLAVDLDDLSLNEAVQVLKIIRERHELSDSGNYQIVYGRFTPDAEKTLLIKERHQPK